MSGQIRSLFKAVIGLIGAATLVTQVGKDDKPQFAVLEDTFDPLLTLPSGIMSTFIPPAVKSSWWFSTQNLYSFAGNLWGFIGAVQAIWSLIRFFQKRRNVDQQTRDLQALQSQVNRLQQAQEQIQDQNATEIAQAKDEIARLRLGNQNKTEQMTAKDDENADLKANVRDLKAKLQANPNQEEVLSTMLQTCKIERDNALEQLSQQKLQTTEIQKSLDVKAKEFDDTDRSLVSTMRDRASWITEATALETALKHEKSQRLSEAADAAQRISKLTNDASTAENKIRAQAKEIESTTEQFSYLQDVLRGVQGKNNALEAELKSAKHSLNTAQHEIVSTRSKAIASGEASPLLSEAYKALEEEKVKLSGEKSELSKDNAKLLAEKDEMSKRIQNHEQTNKNLVETHAIESEKSTDKIAAMEASLAAAKQEHEQEKQSFAANVLELQNLINVREKSATDELTAKRDELENAAKKIAAADESLAASQLEKEALSQTNQGLSLRVADLEKAEQEARNQMSLKLAEAKKAEEGAKETKEHMAHEIEKLRRHNDAREATIHQLRAQLEKSNLAARDLQTKMQQQLNAGKAAPKTSSSANVTPTGTSKEVQMADAPVPMGSDQGSRGSKGPVQTVRSKEVEMGDNQGPVLVQDNSRARPKPADNPGHRTMVSRTQPPRRVEARTEEDKDSLSSLVAPLPSFAQQLINRKKEEAMKKEEQSKQIAAVDRSPFSAEKVTQPRPPVPPKSDPPFIRVEPKPAVKPLTFDWKAVPNMPKNSQTSSKSDRTLAWTPPVLGPRPGIGPNGLPISGRKPGAINWMALRKPISSASSMFGFDSEPAAPPAPTPKAQVPHLGLLEDKQADVESDADEGSSKNKPADAQPTGQPSPTADAGSEEPAGQASTAPRKIWPKGRLLRRRGAQGPAADAGKSSTSAEGHTAAGPGCSSVTGEADDTKAGNPSTAADYPSTATDNPSAAAGNGDEGEEEDELDRAFAEDFNEAFDNMMKE
ncbi:MAG: hypothetical protein Q9219_004507 [cf. Caloplaca sp. 3 TL-2023]